MIKNKKRADGRYKSAVYLGEVEGKPQYKYVYASTARELEKKVEEVKLRLGKGLDVSAERDTFGYWIEKWLKVKKIEVSPGRYATYKARSKNLQRLADVEITKLRLDDFQDLIVDYATEINEKTGKPYAQKTLEDIKNAASQILKLAIDSRVIDYNCAASVKIPKNARKGETRRALTDEEQKWIVSMPHRAQTAAMIMMLAGLRRGEMMALTWQAIDLENATIRVEKFVSLDEGRPEIKDYGKTDAATRTVYIPDALVNYLKNVPGNHFGFVVHKKNGSVMSGSSWREMWDSYLDDLNLKFADWKNCAATKGKCPSKYEPDPLKKPFLIPRITAHWLRHTFITEMYLAGVDILTAKEQAGHRDIETTMEIYTHLDETYKKKNIEKYSERINQKLISMG